MSCRIKVFTACVSALMLASASVCRADALPLPSTDGALATREDVPDAKEQPPGAPPGWGTKYYEWNLPPEIYVPGDPRLLSDENKASGRRLNFVACPILIDSHPTPIWMAKYNGETYFLRAQQNMTAAVHPPQLLHSVLVEGVISNEPRIAGGIVLNPLRLSVLREIDSTCTEMRPAQPGVGVLFAKKPPGPGASAVSRAKDDVVRDKLLAAAPVASATPQERKTFDIRFDFDSDFLKEFQRIPAAVQYARAVKASRIEVHGYRGSALLSNGQTIVEHEGVDKTRAQKIREWLGDYNDLQQNRIAVDWSPSPLPADGISDFDGWHATIVVVPETLSSNNPQTN